MAIPAPWTTLSADEKRTRALAVADELFAREGLDVAMPVLAEAIGVGVGSIYRQVGTKDDLIGELVILRATTLAERFTAARDEPDAWAALRRATFATVEDCVADSLSQSAWDDAAAARADVAAAREAATRALAALVDRARAQGALRPDADHEDLRLVFKAVRELASLGAGGAHRLAELVLRGMAATPD
jgi:AcrR family transcriptional regulator